MWTIRTLLQQKVRTIDERGEREKREGFAVNERGSQKPGRKGAVTPSITSGINEQQPNARKRRQ